LTEAQISFFSPEPYAYPSPSSSSSLFPCIEALFTKTKSNLILDPIDALPYRVDLLLGYWEAKSAFGIAQCDRKVMPSVEFPIVVSRKQHLFAGALGVEGELITCV
jgi:hypothetical protein